MTTTNRPDGVVDLEWASVEACTLPTAERPLRVAAFDEVFGSSLRAVERPEGGTRARLMLAGGADLADDLANRVQSLADAETSCCSFFTFGVTTLEADPALDSAPGVALDIEVPAAYVGVLDALVDRAQAVAGQPS